MAPVTNAGRRVDCPSRVPISPKPPDLRPGQPPVSSRRLAAEASASHFTTEDLTCLRDQLRIPDDALTALHDLRFTGDVWAVPEGRIVVAGEPLLQVTAPIAEAQLVETALLNHLTYQIAIASKARGVDRIEQEPRSCSGAAASP